MFFGTRPHFALLSRSSKQGDELKLFKRRLSNLNITPIWLDSFDDINLVLEQLAPATLKKPVTKGSDIFVGREKELKSVKLNWQRCDFYGVDENSFS